MLLIINLGILLTLIIIILFNIINIKHQVILTLSVLSLLIIFKVICDNMIKKNRSNDEVVNNNLINNNSNNSNNIVKCNGCKENVCIGGCIGCKENGCNKCNKCKENGCNGCSGCINTNEKQNENKFDLNNLNVLLNDMKNISNNYNENNNENIDRINVNKNNYIFSKHSGNKDYHFKDLHNGIFFERKNVSNKNSLLLDNVDCSNDNSCIIEPTIYNFHKY